MTLSARVGPATPLDAAVRARLRARAVARFTASMDTATGFFEANAEAVSQACLAMAGRFTRGGRLLVFGAGAEATDAHHVAVEFVHPVLVGKRALPAIALTSDVATLTGVARDAGAGAAFARTVELIGRPADIALGLARAEPGPAVRRGLDTARRAGLLTIGVFGQSDTGPGGADVAAPDAAHGLDGSDRAPQADHVFVVPSDDPLVVQEVQETLYHIMWELVHVFFEQDVVT